MREDLDKQLCEKFPKMFQTTSKLKNPFFGFEHEDGWFNIIRALCANIQWHIDQSIAQNARALEYNKMREQLIAGDPTMFDEQYGKYAGSDPEWVNRRREKTINGDPRKVPEIVSQVVVDQVKEKFGSLRFYYHGGDEKIDGMVRMAESMSGCTCEECGAPGERRSGGWIRTLCDVHAKK